MRTFSPCPCLPPPSARKQYCVSTSIIVRCSLLSRDFLSERALWSPSLAELLKGLVIFALGHIIGTVFYTQLSDQTYRKVSKCDGLPVSQLVGSLVRPLRPSLRPFVRPSIYPFILLFSPCPSNSQEISMGSGGHASLANWGIMSIKLGRGY